MEKIISARHFHLDEDTKGFIVEHLEHLEAKHQRLTSARVVVEIQRQSYFAEVVIHGKRLQIGAKAQASELRPAIEMAFDRDRSLYRVADGNPARTRQFMDLGLLPWWCTGSLPRRRIGAAATPGRFPTRTSPISSR